MTRTLTRYDTTFYSMYSVKGGKRSSFSCLSSPALATASVKAPTATHISGVKVKSRCVVRAKLIMAMGHRLIPIALLSAPATPVLGGTKGSTDRWDRALWDSGLNWHKSPPKRPFFLALRSEQIVFCLDNYVSIFTLLSSWAYVLFIKTTSKVSILRITF